MKQRKSIFTSKLIIALLLVLATHALPEAAEKLPANLAGEIGQPTGNIAFIRSKDVWMMNHRGQNQMRVCEATNAEGKLSWSPDGTAIVFTRAGQVNYKAPDNTGGVHKVYDLFLGYPDSAKAGKAYWWLRITDDLGGRFPEWTHDGTIIYTKDMNANQVNALLPNYQICTIDSDGSNFDVLRKDWQNMSEFFISPTMNKKGDIAFVHFYDKSEQGAGRPNGIAVLNQSNIMQSVDSVRLQSSKNKDAIGPSFSPDGKWIAYINNNMTNPGMYITTPDLKKTYLVFEPPPGIYINTLPPSFSPNSKWITFATTDGSIWICDITGNNSKRISGPGFDTAPAWSK